MKKSYIQSEWTIPSSIEYLYVLLHWVISIGQDWFKIVLGLKFASNWMNGTNSNVFKCVLSFRSGLKTTCTTQLFLMKLHFGRKKVQYTIIDGYLCKMSTFLNVYKLLILYCIVILLICVPSALWEFLWKNVFFHVQEDRSSNQMIHFIKKLSS